MSDPAPTNPQLPTTQVDPPPVVQVTVNPASTPNTVTTNSGATVDVKPAPQLVVPTASVVQTPQTDPNYQRNYWINVGLVGLSILAVICNVIVSFSGTFFGLTDTQWHYVLAFAAIVTALNTAFNHTPPVTQWPSKVAH